MKDKILKYLQITFFVIYFLFSIGLFASQVKYKHSLINCILFLVVGVVIALIIKFKDVFRKILNNKVVFILCVCLGIILRIILLFLDYPELTGAGDYSTFFYNACKFAETNSIGQQVYVAIFPYLMPYIVILGTVFKLTKISYFGVVLLNIVLDLITSVFLYYTFRNKKIRQMHFSMLAFKSN